MSSQAVIHIVKDICQNVYETLKIVIEDLERFYIVLYDNVKSSMIVPFAIENDKHLYYPTRPFEEEILPDCVVLSKKTIKYDRKQLVQRLNNGYSYWPDVGKLPTSIICSPIFSGNKVVGILVIEKLNGSQGFDHNTVSLLEDISGQVSISIAKATLFDQLKESNKRLGKKAEAQKVVHNVGLKLIEGIELGEDEILKIIKHQSSKVMDTENMYVAIYTPDEKDVYYHNEPDKSKVYGDIRFGMMYINDEPVEMDSRTAEPGKYGRTEYILANKKPLLIKNKIESSKWYSKVGHKDFLDEPFSAWLGIPIEANGKIIGVIATYHREKEYLYDEDDQEVLSMLGNQAAAALEKAWLYDKQLKENIALSKLIDWHEFSGQLVHKINNITGRLRINIDYVIDDLISKLGEESIVVQELKEIKNDIENVNEMIMKFRESTSLLQEDKTQNYKVFKVSESIDKILINIIGLQKYDDWKEKYKVIQNYMDVDIYIETYEELFLEVLNNIITNAFQAMPNGGELLLQTQKVYKNDKCYCRILIKDTGVGIPAQDLKKIYNISYTKRKNGLGYGLWIVKSISDAINMAISLDSQIECGTTFCIDIPIYDDLLRGKNV